MVINIPKHNIVSVENIGIKETPLAFINTEDTSITAKICLNEEFGEEKYSKILPYDKVDCADPFLFKKDGTPVLEASIKNDGAWHKYEASGAQEYTPMQFTCSSVAKRNATFRSDISYDLKIAASEGNSDLVFSKKLIGLFGNASQRGFCPPNVVVNSNSTIPQSLTSGSITEMDFIVIDSTDGIHTIIGDKEAEIDIEYVLGEHTNIWTLVDNFEEVLEKTERTRLVVGNSDGELLKGDNILYSADQYCVDRHYLYEFKEDKYHSAFPKEEYEYELFHPSVLFIKKPHNGYVIVTPKAMLDNLQDNARLIFEFLMTVYLRSYIKSNTLSSWITEKPVDRIALSATKLNKKHKTITFDQLFDGKELYDNFEIDSIEIDKESVAFLGADSYGELSFMKISSFSDIPKTEEQVSFLTTKGTIINYTEEDLWKINKIPQIRHEILDGDVYITVEPFMNSDKHLWIKRAATAKIQNKAFKQSICISQTAPGVEGILQLVPTEVYDPETDGVEIATVEVQYEPKITTCDIRVRGGGLPLTREDDYEMLDIGHPDGRPYRAGSSIVIKLPKRLKQYDSRIRGEVQKHISAGDYPFFVYEEDKKN